MFDTGINSQLKFLSGNVLQMILFDKLKTGNSVIDTIMTTMVITIISYTLQFIHTKLVDFTDMVKSFDFESWFYKKNIVEYEGNIALTTTYYDNNLNQTNSFSDRFKALWLHVIDNIGDNDTIKHIKEYSFDNYSTRNNRDMGIYMVIQNTKFLISKEHQIYAYTTIRNETKDDDNNNKNNKSKHISKIEKITIQLISYRSNIHTIKQYVDNITKNYLSSIEDLRENKKFIYTLTKTKYDDNKYELWDENLFSSTRQFSNIFFHDKPNFIKKLDFFFEQQTVVF